MRARARTLAPLPVQVLSDGAAGIVAAGYDEAAGFLVVMSKVKPQPKAPAAAPAAAPVAAPAAAAPAAATAPSTAATATDAPAPAPTDAYTAGASSFVTGGELEATVAGIVDMGFPRDDVLRALRAAFNNPERAVEYLMTGIPDGVGGGGGGDGGAPAAPAPGPAAAAAPAAAAPPPPPPGPNAQPLDLFGGAPPAAGAGAPAAPSPLDFLRSNPQFALLRSVVAANPAALQPLLAELGRAQPDLLALVNAHQADFLRLLNEPLPPGADAAALAALGGGGGGPPPGAVTVQLTQEEAAAVGRLEALGFGRDAALEAFLACDKDEALAANYLFDTANDD